MRRHIYVSAYVKSEFAGISALENELIKGDAAQPEA